MPARLCSALRMVVALALACACASAGAQANAQPGYAEMLDALSRAHGSVVGIRAQATEDARSAQTLGRERTGSGVVIGADGLILTIGYLVLEADGVQVVTPDGRAIPARTVAYDLATGFGLVRPVLPLRDVPPARLGSASQLQAGEGLMVAMGDVSGGTAAAQLAGRRPFSGYWEYHIDGALFTTPPVANHSGAALFNLRGELVGIGSLFVSDVSGEGARLPGNMFVPVDLIKPILPELRRTGTSAQSRRPWLGVSSSQQGGRVHVVRVSKEGPASAAGVQPGDVILAVDGVKVASLEEFYKQLWAHTRWDADIELTVLRGPEIRVLGVNPVDRMSTIARPRGI
jgi:serine protease Do